MARPKRASAVLAATGLLAATTLSGCQLLTAQPPVHTPTALEACATDRAWDLDTAAFAPVATTVMHEHGVPLDIAVQGTQRLTWGSDFAMHLDSDLTFIASGAASPGREETLTVRGQSGGLAYFAGTIAVPRQWSEDGLTAQPAATQDGAPVNGAVAWPRLWIDDTNGLEVTCSEDQLQLAARQGPLVWTFRPEGWTPPAPEPEPAPAQ